MKQTVKDNVKNIVKNVGKLQIATPSDREIAMIRVFDAPRSLVFDAFTKPELLKRWLGVRGGWTFAVCEVDLKVGGYIAARFAPYAPMRHALALGIVGLIPGVGGAIYAISRSDLGPSLYPIALALVGLPCCWLGGVIYRARHPER